MNFHLTSPIYSLNDGSGNSCLFLYFQCLAVKHYGLTPTENVIKNLGQALLGNDMNLTSLFTTDHHNSHDRADFHAAELGAFNKTIAGVFPSPSFGFGKSSLQARNLFNSQCQGHGNIEDNLNSNQMTAVWFYSCRHSWQCRYNYWCC